MDTPKTSANVRKEKHKDNNRVPLTMRTPCADSKSDTVTGDAINSITNLYV